MDQPAEEFKTRTFKIPEGNMRLFEERLNKLIKRSKKLNSEPIGFKTLNTILVPITEYGEETGGFETYFEIEVTGTAPKLEGWDFIGTIDHNRDDSGKVVNLLRNVPGKSIPHKYHDVGTNCDHCGKNIYRKDTFIVEKDGDTKQVGRSCLKDFLGHKNPEQVAQYAQFVIVSKTNAMNAIIESTQHICAMKSLRGPQRWFVNVASYRNQQSIMVFLVYPHHLLSMVTLIHTGYLDKEAAKRNSSVVIK